MMPTRELMLYRGQGEHAKPSGYRAVVDLGVYAAWARYLIWRPEFSRADGKIRAYTTGEDRQKWYLHRIITQAPRGLVVDHINGNPLDNRLVNLRVCTRSENAMNRVAKRRKRRSQYKGVHPQRYKASVYWMASIRVDGRAVHLGSFETEHEAALAYDAAALQHHGKFACLNFPDPGERCGQALESGD